MQFWWLEVVWFGQIVVFQTDYDKIELQKSVMTSFQFRHLYYVTENAIKLASQDFLILGSSQPKFLATPMLEQLEF